MTEMLLAAHAHGGMPCVKRILRCAVVNFSAEYLDPENPSPLPDNEILAELAEAVKTPCYRQ